MNNNNQAPADVEIQPDPVLKLPCAVVEGDHLTAKLSGWDGDWGIVVKVSDDGFRAFVHLSATDARALAQFILASLEAAGAPSDGRSNV